LLFESDPWTREKPKWTLLCVMKQTTMFLALKKMQISKNLFLTMSSELTLGRNKFMILAVSALSKMPYKALMELFSPTDKQGREKPLQWWETTKILSGRESYLEVLIMSLLPFKHHRTGNMWSELVLSRYTTNKYLICWIWKGTSKNNLRKVHRSEFLLRAWGVYQLNLPIKCLSF